MDLKNLINNNVESRTRTKEVLNNYVYYIVIAIISILVAFVAPIAAGSVNGDISLMFPKTRDGWILWSVINASTAIGNMSLLFLFKQQAKKNASKHPNYIKAKEILNKLNGKDKEFIPRSPGKMNSSDYVKKCCTIAIGSVASFVTFTSIAVNFDVVTLISTLCSVIVAVVISWTTMVKDEEYWTNEYLLYAQYVNKKLNPEMEEQVEPEKEEKNA